MGSINGSISMSSWTADGSAAGPAEGSGRPSGEELPDPALSWTGVLFAFAFFSIWRRRMRQCWTFHG